MPTSTVRAAEPRYNLERHGIQNVNNVYWNLSTPLLYEEALRRHEGRMAHLGSFVVRTGQYTGRSPHDKFIVREPSSANQVWWGDVNRTLIVSRFCRTGYYGLVFARRLHHLRVPGNALISSKGTKQATSLPLQVKPIFRSR